MASYLERYRNGEHEQVWNELMALGDQVRQEPVYSDALAVARETMQRARRNIDTLYQRLQDLGFQFQCEKPYDGKNPVDSLRDQIAGDSMMESVFGGMLSGLESVQDQLSNMFGMNQPDSADTPPRPAPRALAPPPDDIVQQLDRFEKEIGPLPLSIRAWCEIVGSVDFIGDYPGLASYTRDDSGDFDLRGMVRQMAKDSPKPAKNTDDEAVEDYLKGVNSPFASAMVGMYRLMKRESDTPEPEPEPEANAPAEPETWWATDPLVFDFRIDAEEAQWEMEQQAEYGESAPGTYGLMVAPDSLHKANTSGSTYDIVLPDSKADTFLQGADLHFVAYLRNSFAWGGFPGLEEYPERDEKLLASLKEGLEPI